MTPDTLTFSDLEMLWLLPVALVLGAWAALQLRGRSKLLARLGSGPVIARLVASFSPRTAGLRIALWTVALVLIALAAARPRYGLRETEVSNAGIDIAFVVDASKSMLVRDVVPSRLRGTMLEISALLDKLAGGRVALVPFAGIAYVQCPLTTDHDVIRTYLEDLKPDDLPVGGTNIGRAISLATEMLTGEKEKAEAELRDNLVPQFKGSKHKAIVLFSDGEDHEGGALDAARKAAAAGIRVYTVGVGTATGNPVPLLGPDGTATGVLKDENGNPIFSELNSKLLTDIANLTGGKYFQYANKSVALPLFQALDGLEKAEYLAQWKLLGEDRYQVLLGPALLLLLGEAALSNRKRKKTKAVAKKLAPGLVTLLLALLMLGAQARPALAVPTWLQHENPDMADGRAAMTAQKYGEAVKSFQAAQASRPEHVLIWYDLGLAQAALGAHGDAATSFARALGGMRQRDPALEAQIHYATGTLQLQWARKLEADALATKPAAKDKEAKPEPAPGVSATTTQAAPPPEDPLPHYRLAVGSLEQALLADPTRVETRRNLELARLGAYPPCRSRDKAYEPNDQVDQAAAVAFAGGQREQTLDLRACPEDRDLFRVDLQPGDRFSAKVTTKADKTSVTEPDDAQGAVPPKLGISLLSQDGKEQIRGPVQGTPALQAVDLGKVDRAQTVLIDVRNVAEVETPYDLGLKLLPACQRIEDKFEPNDTPQAARQVTVGQPVQGRLCPLNDDNFAIMLQEGQGLGIKAKTKVDIGDEHIEITILDPAGREVAHAKKGKEGLVARLALAQVTGTYVVQVRGGLDTEADYELAVEILPPCRERDDAFEENDQAVQANPLESQDLSQPMDKLQLCPGDDDWFAVELKQGESLFVDLQAALEDVPDAQDLAGALTVEVYDERGVLWGAGVGSAVTGGAALSRTVAVLEPPAGKYRVRVTGGGVEAPHFPLPQLPEGAVQRAAPDPGAGAGAGPGAAAAPPPPPPPHVVLPPGFAAPAVRAGEARLDLPYSLKMKILPPCPAGNDELEPNNTAGEAKTVEVGSERLMRICKGDQDWVQIAQKTGQNLQISARYDLSHGAVEMEAFDEGGTNSLAKGQRSGTGAKGAVTPDEDTPAARKGRTGVTALGIQGTKADRTVKVRIHGDGDNENFYLLRVEEPPPPTDKDKKDQEDKDKKDQDDKDKKDQDKKDQDKKDQPQDKPQPPKDEKEKQRLKQQMDRGDHNPTNLEAEEALRRSPFRNEAPAKDW